MASIEIIQEKCVGCRLCVPACPFNAIRVADRKASILQEQCTLCGACVSSCKFSAILLTEDDAAPSEDLSSYKGVWVFAEQRDGVPAHVVSELLGEGSRLAADLSEELSAVLIGDGVGDTAGELIARGADTVYVVDHPSLRTFNDESYTDIMVQLIRTYKPEIVLMGATAYGRSLAPRISSRIRTGLTADCTGLAIDPETRLLRQTRPAFGGNLMATIICPDKRPQMSSVRPKVMKAVAPDPSRQGRIVTPDVAIPDALATRVVPTVESTMRMVNLAEADIIVSAGRGIGDRKNLCLIEELAEVLGAAVGASRAVVDAGWIEYCHQVGQTGKTVGPKVYFACGISGAIQHQVGMSSSDTIIAINKDPDAPIFKIATFGIVGDVLEIVPALIREFKARL